VLLDVFPVGNNAAKGSTTGAAGVFVVASFGEACCGVAVTLGEAVLVEDASSIETMPKRASNLAFFFGSVSALCAVCRT